MVERFKCLTLDIQKCKDVSSGNVLIKRELDRLLAVPGQYAGIMTEMKNSHPVGRVDNAQALRACGPVGPHGFESHSRRQNNLKATLNRNLCSSS